MKRKHSKFHLNANISYYRPLHCYRIVIDGDEFWADTYEHACCKLCSLILRDEIISSIC